MQGGPWPVLHCSCNKRKKQPQRMKATGSQTVSDTAGDLLQDFLWTKRDGKLVNFSGGVVKRVIGGVHNGLSTSKVARAFMAVTRSIACLCNVAKWAATCGCGCWRVVVTLEARVAAG